MVNRMSNNRMFFVLVLKILSAVFLFFSGQATAYAKILSTIAITPEDTIISISWSVITILLLVIAILMYALSLALDEEVSDE